MLFRSFSPVFASLLLFSPVFASLLHSTFLFTSFFSSNLLYSNLLYSTLLHLSPIIFILLFIFWSPQFVYVTCFISFLDHSLIPSIPFLPSLLVLPPLIMIIFIVFVSLLQEIELRELLVSTDLSKSQIEAHRVAEKVILPFKSLLGCQSFLFRCYSFLSLLLSCS